MDGFFSTVYETFIFMSREGDIFMSVLYVCTHFAKFIRMYNFFQWYLRLFCTYHHLKKYLSILKKVYFNHDLTWFILSVFLTVILLHHFYFTLLYFTLLYFSLLYFTLPYFILLYFTFFTLLCFTFTELNFTLLSSYFLNVKIYWKRFFIDRKSTRLNSSHRR